MISPNAEPIAHISPYKRIELGVKEWPKRVEAEPVVSPYDQLFRNILAPGATGSFDLETVDLTALCNAI